MNLITELSIGTTVVISIVCLTIISLNKKKALKSSGVNFTLDISTGKLAENGGFLVKDSVMIARTNTREFIAVSASCSHQGSVVCYNPGSNNFSCPSHQAHFDCNGQVIQGPATKSLKKYSTTLTGNSLRVFS